MWLSKRSNVIYYIFYKNEKNKYTCTSTKHRSKSEALKFLSNFEKQLTQKQNEKTAYIELDRFAFEFLKYSESIHSPKHTDSIKVTFSVFQRFTTNVALRDIKSDIIQDYVEMRISKVSSFSVRRDLANLSSAFNWGISKRYMINNPTKGIKKPRIIEKQPLFFDEQSFNTFIRAIKEKDLKDLVMFAVNSGLRHGELITLEWIQVNLKDRIIILDNRNTLTKSKRVRTIPLNLTGLQILSQRQMSTKSNLVYTFSDAPINPDYLSRRFKEYIKLVGLNHKLTFRNLRHTFASWLVQRGVSIYEVSKLLGHSDIKVTEVYSHLRAEDLRKSVNSLNN
jgi:integrase